MKKIGICFLMVCGLILSQSHLVLAQSQEAQQLLLDVQKYNQLKKMLSQLVTGYNVVKNGYDNVKGIASGSFDLHNAFINGLYAVNPAVKKYQRIPDIIHYETAILQEYKSSYSQFKQDGHFNPNEIDYMGNVYSNLVNKSVENINELIMVTTANKTQMSDDERLQAIDRIFYDIQDKYVFLKSFNNSTKMLALQRARQQGDINMTKALYGIK